MTSHDSSMRDHAAALLTALGRLSGAVASVVEDGTARAVAVYRLELRRVAAQFALALAAAFLVCASMGFAVCAILMAFWDTHRVLATGCIAAGLALCALACAQLMRSNTRKGP